MVFVNAGGERDSETKLACMCLLKRLTWPEARSQSVSIFHRDFLSHLVDFSAHRLKCLCVSVCVIE